MTEEELKILRDEKNVLLVYRQLSFRQRAKIFKLILDEYFGEQRNGSEYATLVKQLILSENFKGE